MNFSTLQAGIATERRLIVDRERTISFLGEDLRIYATPRLVDDIEQTCLDYLLTFLDEGENTVGAAVDIRHVGATLLGMSVSIVATVTRIEGRSITFNVEVRDDVELVATAAHTRVVVNVAKLRSRVQAKAEAAAAGEVEDSVLSPSQFAASR
ncbi:Predicted thioesterase [Pseudomonas frederiksbergensis]|jgi:predicted thioesterase|uniref:Predicted thioesterase n=1 Tax=Pseudomonas frederiksbergensis TaxID=104087 RepID=A0A1H5F6G2_9PSED|nr:MULTISPECIES: thioesterase family protein [Pseudomonas]PMU12645.1 LysR family transcriptional regulator [Pseudomonas sp. FW305-20]PMU22225.1 LysR family transcriptional regulator [Pseudomonas sp. FW305-122]PMU43429.1 LysR family transcriptional regulator [Pseudomonas sp. FW305-47B]PMX57739.1 LysR family transcriptional regulator [Pseudomonas sp. FW305-33]PMX64713.1 LysR family transcriptional regulator [Pseudomonas sp. FW305-60]